MKPRCGSVAAPAAVQVSKLDRRGAWTYLSLICNCTEIQGMLPHYLIGSKTRLTRKLLRAQQALPQTRLKIVAQKSAWTSAANMVQLLRDIREVLKLYPSKQGILLLDCAPSHLPKQVMQREKNKEAKKNSSWHTYRLNALICFNLWTLLGLLASKAFLRARHEELKASSQHGFSEPPGLDL